MQLIFTIGLLFIAILAVTGQPSAITQPATPPSVDSDTLVAGGKVVVPAEKLRAITVPKTDSKIVIDGRLDEESWRSAAVFKDFYQTSPGNNTAPSRPTEVYMFYDEKHLYIGFKCWDEKDKIRATLAKRDNVFGEDNVRVWLDTFNDQRRAYILAFNPLGVQQDGIFTEGQGADFSVDIVMESKGVIEDWGWSVEVKIPFKSLRYRAGEGVLWGFNVARNIDRFNDEFNQWLPDDRDVAGLLVKHGKITGFNEVKYERTLEVVPSVTMAQTSRRVRTIPRYALLPSSIDPGRIVNEPVKPEFGVTLKYTVTPSITLDAAINPDFAEIEADAPVVTANQRFPIFFQEKRPFFLEGADTFKTPIQIFYSRAIIDPDLALKLTGKSGKHSFGILVASDKAPGNYDEDDRNDRRIRPRIDEFLDKSALFGVLRYKRDLGAENSIGFFGTYRSFPEQKNAVFAVDGRMKFTNSIVSQFQVAASTSKRCFLDVSFEPTLDPVQALRNRQVCGGGSYGGETVLGNPYQQYRSGNGISYSANLDSSKDTRGWFIEISGRSKEFRTDAGFNRRGNTNSGILFNRLSSKSRPDASIVRTNWRQFGGWEFDWDGRVQGFRAGTGIGFNFQKRINLGIEANNSYSKIYEDEFGLKRMPTRPLGTFFGDPTRATWQQSASMNISQNVNKRFSYGLWTGGIRNQFDFFYADPVTGLQDPGTGMQLDGEVWGSVRPVDKLSVSASYRKSRLTRNDNRRRVFDSDIVTVRSTYQFTRFFFARVRFDHNASANNYSGQALFGWAPNPGTAFYVGYNDNANRNGFNPFTGQFEPGFERNARTFFIRASYLLRRSF
jgi:hypothetical protein